MPDQEFLASFAVEIDEPGVSRLRQVLEENRKLADRLAVSFDTASASIRSLAGDLGVLPDFSGRGIVTEGLSGFMGPALGLDLSQASKDLDSFTDLVKQPVSLKADASGIVSAGRSARDSLRDLFSAPLRIRADPETAAGPENGGPARLSSGSGGEAASGEKLPRAGTAAGILPGTADLRELAAALSPAARERLPDSAGSLALPAGLSAGAVPAGNVTQDNRTVSAPVSIQVQASGADPEEIGRSLYETAERYLLRTLRSVSG